MSAIRGHTHSPRTLLALLKNLPDTSALAAAIAGVPRGWGADRHYLVTLIDALQANTWVTVAVARKRKPRRPKPMDRPKRKQKRVVLSVQQLLALRPNDDG